MRERNRLHWLSILMAGPLITAAPGGPPPTPLGDRSFIDASARGVERANTELGLSGQIIETNSIAEQETAIRAALAQGNDLILALAPDSEILLAIAAENPDQKFGVPSDIFVESLPANVQAFQVNVHEGSFLVGGVAGVMTETKTVGAVAGGDAPGLNQFFWAYKQGVLAVCADCQVLVSYLAFDFGNPTLGKEAALVQYDQGADIIFQVAGRSGEGVLSAAAATGKVAIGVDSNQDYIQPGSIIVSMLKKVDVSTFLLVKDTLRGTSAADSSRSAWRKGQPACPGTRAPPTSRTTARPTWWPSWPTSRPEWKSTGRRSWPGPSKCATR